MKAPRCAFCGVEEWGHLCSGAAPSEIERRATRGAVTKNPRRVTKIPVTKNRVTEISDEAPEARMRRGLPPYERPPLGKNWPHNNNNDRLNKVAGMQQVLCPCPFPVSTGIQRNSVIIMLLQKSYTKKVRNRNKERVKVHGRKNR